MDDLKELTTSDLIQWFGRDADYHSVTPILLNELIGNVDALYTIRGYLSRDAEVFCPLLRPDILERLINAVVDEFGLSNAICATYLAYMPERSSRLKLAEWSGNFSTSSGVAMDTSSRQRVLSLAMLKRSHSLAHDIVDWMSSLGEAGFAKETLCMFGRKALTLAKLDSFLGEVEHVSRLCLTKNFLFAETVAISDLAEAELRRHIALTIECPGRKWSDIFHFVATRNRRPDQDVSDTLKKYESVGVLLTKRIRAMSSDKSRYELTTDDARMMAHQLGAKCAVHQMESDKYRSKALEVSFDI